MLQNATKCNKKEPRHPATQHLQTALSELDDPTTRTGQPAKVNEPVGPASEHPLVQLRMACRADNEQVDLQFGCKLDDIA